MYFQAIMLQGLRESLGEDNLILCQTGTTYPPYNAYYRLHTFILSEKLTLLVILAK